jgi:hypothetical protein
VELKTVRIDSWTNVTIEKNCLLFLVLISLVGEGQI